MASSLPTSELLPFPAKQNKAAWGKFATLAGMAATIVLLVGLLVLSLAGVRPPDAPVGSNSRPATVQTVLSTPPIPTATPTAIAITKSALDIYNPKMLLQKALMDLARPLNLAPDVLFARLEKGETLAGIAKQQGVGVESLKKLLLVNFETQLAAAVNNGELTQSQADTILNASGEFIDTFVNNSVTTVQKIPPTK